MTLQCLFEMDGVFFAYIFHPEVVHDQCELNWAPVVFPETWDQFALSVTVFIETFFEQFIG